jgi:hypothetical protein
VIAFSEGVWKTPSAGHDGLTAPSSRGRGRAPGNPSQSAEVLHLPVLPPDDLNPIAPLFAKLEALLRKASESSMKAMGSNR